MSALRPEEAWRSGAMPPKGAMRSLRSKASPSMVWGSGRSVNGLDELAELDGPDADPSAALRDDDKGDEGSADEDGNGPPEVEGAVVGCVGWRPAKRSNWWPERKRSCIQRKM